MLSSQTRDEQTSAAVRRLQAFGLNVEKMCEIKEEDLSELIKGCSFHKVKAKYIKENAEILKSKFESKVPEDLDSILSLKGVGMKMGSLLV